MVKIGIIRKTISLEASLYNDAVGRMRQLRIDDFSKYIRYMLRMQADEVKLCRELAREHFQKGSFYKDLADGIEETRENMHYESNDQSKGRREAINLL